MLIGMNQDAEIHTVNVGVPILDMHFALEIFRGFSQMRRFDRFE